MFSSEKIIAAGNNGKSKTITAFIILRAILFLWSRIALSGDKITNDLLEATMMAEVKRGITMDTNSINAIWNGKVRKFSKLKSKSRAAMIAKRRVRSFIKSR